MTQLTQRGSSHIIALVGVLVIAAAGFVGYRVLNNTTSVASNNNVVASQTKVPAKLNSTADLKKADAALNSTTIDGSVNPNQLDSDINSL